MGLIAREIESRGIPTLSLTSALSITASVNPPRAAYVDYPLGHTAGKPLDPANQMAILKDALAGFASIRTPGTILRLHYEWQADDGWKDRVMRPDPARASSSHADDRVARLDTPQYQSEQDASLADPDCPTCIFLKEP